MAGLKPAVRIIPFRGEYYELDSEASQWVRGLIYQVPDPSLPFLGVHLTRMIGGGVHAGPDAVLALAREGYRWSNVNARDLWATLNYAGFPTLATRNIGVVIREVVRSFSAHLFARYLSRLVPGLEASHLVPRPSGVRAQAVDRKGRLFDDFVIHRTDNQIHILNAPSPAATASLAIADHIVSSL
jgi:(S)-2-hydroxyglutarate dehydrogenase